MSKTIGLFPGQGSQYIGMGKDLAEKSTSAQKLLYRAEEVLGFKISQILFDGPEEELKKTENTQPALYIVSMMVYEVLKEKGLQLDYVAGHSLGEYSAVCAAGGFSFEEGLQLVRLRGELMAQAGVKAPGAMSAIIGMEVSELLDVLEMASHVGLVVPANFNCPGQIVISGEVEAVEKAGKIITEAGKKAIPLPVSGAFHSPLMEFAKTGLAEKINSMQFNDLNSTLIANVTANSVKDGGEIKQLLVKQLTSPVQWTLSMEKALELGVTQAYEIGAGKVLMGLARKISRDLKVTCVESMDSLAQVVTQVEGSAIHG